MPGLFSRFKGKDTTKAKKKNGVNELSQAAPAEPQWVDAWTRKTVDPEEIHELIRCCTEELKARGLDLPFLLLPFRPTSDPSAVRTFIRHFFDQKQSLRGDALAQEIRMTGPMVVSGVVKWCWSRLQGGVVGWDAYELFKVGEYDSNMARDSFKTFIPISVENGARQRIIFDFFDLLAAIAAHGKSNGLGGRKLSRMAAWWAFEQKDTGDGFEGGYNAWLSAADATSHLFFAYLRSLAPEQNLTGISMLPMSLQKLLHETEYPPEKPELMMSRTNKVVMIVESVSPTPFALLRRANHFQYRDSDRALQEFATYEDPIQALSEECKRVLKAVSAANQSQVSSSKHSTSLRDASWSRFEDIGFASALEEEDEDEESALGRKKTEGLKTTPSSGNGLARPTTPSWADFLSSGFLDDNRGRSNLLLPPDKVLPPIDMQNRQRSSQSHHPRLESERNLDPGELASITFIDLDDAFWWVWMSSLAPEETPERKAAFGRCAVVETKIRSGRWLVMEEMVAGAAPEPQEGAYIAEKKGFFSWTRRGKTLRRRKSTGKHIADQGDKSTNNFSVSKTSIGPDTHAKIQAKAAQLRAAGSQEANPEDLASQRRGRAGDTSDKTTSVLTLQTNIAGEASSAMTWVKKYDKGAIKDAYMANNNAGRGVALSPDPTEDVNGHSETNGSTKEPDARPDVPPKSPEPEPETATQPPPVTKTNTMPPRKPVAVTPEPREPEKGEEPTVTPGPAEAEASEERTVEPASQPEAQSEAPPAASPEGTSIADTASDAAPAPAPASLPADGGKPTKKLLKDKSGFRKLFGRKNRSSKLPDNAASDLNTMLRKGSESTVASVQQPEPAAQEPQVDADDVTERAPDTPKAAAESRPKDAASLSELSAIDPKDDAEAKREFARFDQGPLVDQPAATPADDDDDDEGDATPPPIARRPVQRSASSLKSSHEPPMEEHLSQSAGPGVQDRWAQIRKNAADRASQYHRPEDEHTRSFHSKSQANDDDDTSGEETIESRVARIKARVAELTGTMEGVHGPHGTSGSQSPQAVAAGPAQ